MGRQDRDELSSQRSRELLYATLWMQHSIEYKAATRQAYANAEQQLESALLPGSAELTQSKNTIDDWGKLPPAIIFDLDETVLDNSAFQAYQVKNQKLYDELSWSEWVAAEQAFALDGVEGFLNVLADMEVDKQDRTKRIKVFFVSNRACEKPVDDAPADQLATRCPQLLHTMAVMKSFPQFNERSAYYLAGMYGSLKSKLDIRKEIAKTHRIIMLVGDNLKDFIEPRDLYRQNEAKLSSMWGRRWIIVPNPAYGSWPAELSASVDSAVKERCGDRPKGAENWGKVAAWEECGYEIFYQARFDRLKPWER